VDSNHKLVLTFKDMNDYKERNNIFYELLRDEATIGPIIFIGYRFKHPGALEYLTSPEYDLLIKMIEQMGSSVRWHYCVFPYDEKNKEDLRLIDSLKRKNILVINSTFGDFMQEIIKRIGKIKSPFSGEVNIPVGEGSISIPKKDLLKDNQHFEILNEELFKVPAPSPRDSLNGKYNWSSFKEGHFITRNCRQEFLKAILNVVRDPLKYTLILKSSVGWGKTTLLKDISMELYKKRLPIIWLNPFGTIHIQSDKEFVLGRWDTERLIALIRKVEEVSGGKISPIIIADECDERIDEISTLLNKIEIENLKPTFILSTDPLTYDALKEDYMNLLQGLTFSPEQYNQSDTSELQKLIDFCINTKIIPIDSDKEAILSSIQEDEAEERLIFALQVIYDREHRPFGKIVKNSFESLENEIQRKLVLYVSSINQFGSIFIPRLYTLLKTMKTEATSEIVENYQKCLNKQILIDRFDQEESCVSTQHPLIAEKFLTLIDPSNLDNLLISLIQSMSNTIRDLELIRKLCKKINYYPEKKILSSELIYKIFKTAMNVTDNDWVVCQQYSKFLLKQEKPDKALDIINLAIKNNVRNLSLYHTRGNILKIFASDKDKAQELFDSASEDFAKCRVGGEPSEYPYVTNLDMLIFKLKHETDEQKRIDYQIEGKEIYEEALKTLPDTKLQYLTTQKYIESFQPNEKILNDFCKKIQASLKDGRPSAFSVAFYATRIYLNDPNNYQQAITILEEYQTRIKKSVLILVTEAELHSKESKFSESARCIDSAKRILASAEKEDIVKKVHYLDLILSFLLGEYKSAMKAQENLQKFIRFTKRSYPQGYIWKKTSKQKDPKNKKLSVDGKIWRGRIEDRKVKDYFGTISLTNDAGEVFYINFNPKYFQRSDFKAGDLIEFIVTFLPNRLRADDPGGNHFINTKDDIYVD